MTMKRGSENLSAPMTTAEEISIESKEEKQKRVQTNWIAFLKRMVWYWTLVEDKKKISAIITEIHDKAAELQENDPENERTGVPMNLTAIQEAMLARKKMEHQSRQEALRFEKEELLRLEKTIKMEKAEENQSSLKEKCSTDTLGLPVKRDKSGYAVYQVKYKSQLEEACTKAGTSEKGTRPEIEKRLSKVFQERKVKSEKSASSSVSANSEENAVEKHAENHFIPAMCCLYCKVFVPVELRNAHLRAQHPEQKIPKVWLVKAEKKWDDHATRH